MPIKNIFDKPFDEGTIAKLEIFENYLDNWLPILIQSGINKPLQIFDLFAGTGCDINKIEGSPLRALRIIRKHSVKLRKSKKIVYLYLNDYDENKISSLKEYCNNKLIEYDIADVVKLIFTNIPFIDFLREYKTKINFGCNLIFIDQNGFKEVNEKIFKFLISIDTSEFLFFVSSTFLHRFAKDPDIQNFHPKFDFGKIQNSNRKEVHNVICHEFEKYVPKNIDSYSLIPFSIMKSDKNNVYGLIFVSKHIRGADKFLDVVWKTNMINGNANYDIDEDLRKDQLNIFEGKSLTKIEAFQYNLEQFILSSKLKNNNDVYYYTINAGHIPKHAHEKLVNMKKEKYIDYEGKSPLVNYKQIFNNKRKLEFKVLEKCQNQK